jgi:hypothetical protein
VTMGAEGNDKTNEVGSYGSVLKLFGCD